MTLRPGLPCPVCGQRGHTRRRTAQTLADLLHHLHRRHPADLHSREGHAMTEPEAGPAEIIERAHALDALVGQALAEGVVPTRLIDFLTWGNAVDAANYATVVNLISGEISRCARNHQSVLAAS